LTDLLPGGTPGFLCAVRLRNVFPHESKSTAHKKGGSSGMENGPLIAEEQKRVVINPVSGF
jgi:hypothetical protein